MKTGNTHRLIERAHAPRRASMEPGHEDREYFQGARGAVLERNASMEPGHEDREYGQALGHGMPNSLASMEPGHEDREYFAPVPFEVRFFVPQWSPVMKTGNTGRPQRPSRPGPRLNGARS